MQTLTRERRAVRSQDCSESLILQLARVRDAAHLDALVLATDEGLPVAHAGEPGLCEELAALAPLLWRDRSRVAGRTSRVRAVTVSEELPLYLVSYSRDTPAQLDDWLEHASRGITRILKA